MPQESQVYYVHFIITLFKLIVLIYLNLYQNALTTLTKDNLNMYISLHV
jgi:hypothetical protein